MRDIQDKETPQPIPFIRELCAHLSEENLQEAEASFWRYLDIVRSIHERLKHEATPTDRFDKL